MREHLLIPPCCPPRLRVPWARDRIITTQYRTPRSQWLMWHVLGMIVVLLAGCSPDEEPPPREPPPDTTQNSIAPVEDDALSGPLLPSTQLPSSPGLYWVDGDGVLQEMARGDVNAIHPTNAARRFAFDTPQGTVLSESQPLFVLWTGSLELSTLRLNRFDADALLTAPWWDLLERGRRGWLPGPGVRLEVEPIPERPGLARIRPVDPLPNGFYVLHDRDMNHGRQRADVEAYFPFEVTNNETSATPEQRWLMQAETCVDEIMQVLIDSHTIETVKDGQRAWFDRTAFASAQMGRMRRCAERVQAVGGSASNPAVRKEAQALLVTLDAIAHGVPWEEWDLLMETTQREHKGAAMLAYWLELSTQETAWSLRQALVNRDTRSAGAAARALAAAYQVPTPTTAIGADALAFIPNLLWVPYALDPEWSRLPAFTARLATDLPPWEELAVLLAAHQMTRLERFGERYPDSPLVPLAEAMAKSAPAEVRAAAETLDPKRGRNAAVIIGATHVESEEPETVPTTAIEQGIQGRRAPLTACYQQWVKRENARPGLVLIQTTLRQSFLGHSSRIRVLFPRRPDGVSARFGDEAFVECLERDGLSGLPADTLQADAVLTTPVIFHGDRAALATLR